MKRSWRCRLGLHRWCAVPRWELQHTASTFGNEWAETLREASIAPWPGGAIGYTRCAPWCVECGKGER